jgi:hypothetical protein
LHDIVGVPKFNLVPKLNFISDDSIKDKIVSWQESMAALTPTTQSEASDKPDGDIKKEDGDGDKDVTNCNTDASKDKNESKAILLSFSGHFSKSNSSLL